MSLTELKVVSIEADLHLMFSSSHFEGQPTISVFDICFKSYRRMDVVGLNDCLTACGFCQF